jgi:outer membrane immunogenic protein
MAKRWIASMAFASGLAAMSGSVMADGYEPGGARYVRPFSWTGFYIGAQAGGAWGTAEYEVPATLFTHRWDVDGGFVGGMVGFNYQVSGLVVGIQGEWNASDISGSQINIIGNLQSAKLDEFGSVDGRLGVALGRAMPYIIGGVAFGDPRQKFTIGTAGPSTTFAGGDSTGWDIGIGLEVALVGGLTGRFEYRHYDFGNISVEPDNVVLGLRHVQSMEFNTARFGLAYKFGGDDRYREPLK